MVEITWDEYALENIQEIYDFIAKDSTRHAEKQVNIFLQRIVILRTFPLSGKMVPEFEIDSVRELVEGNYRIIYEVFSDDAIGILTVHHSAKLL